MISYDVDIRLAAVDEGSVREAVAAHQRTLQYTGDFFMGSKWLDGRQLAIEVDGKRIGVAAVIDGAVSLCTIDTDAMRYDRQILRQVLAETGATRAWAASWDHHHVNLFGNFATTINNQAYQFELVRRDDLREPVPGLRLDLAVPDDLDYLTGTGFLDDYDGFLAKGDLRIARLNGAEVGVGVVEPQPMGDDRVDIGMFTNPGSRRTGVGRSILALAAREVLASGRTPAAGCGWDNWASRRSLESAGLTCVGTIFWFELDPGRFDDRQG